MSGFIRHTSLWILAAGFSWATVILASGPLRALRKTSPFWVYWPSVALITAGFWHAAPWVPNAQMGALGFLAVAVVVGIFTEIEAWGVSRGYAAFGSLFALVAGAGVGFGAWCRSLKISPVTWLTKWVEGSVVKLKELNPALNFDVETVVNQLPSGLIVVGLMVLAIAVVSERTWLRLLDAPEGEKESVRKWTDFRLWDVSIYVLMTVLLAAFVRHDVKAVSVIGLNALNVLVVLYFFQGMAVVFKAFDFFGVGPIWRMIVGFILTFQLALIVAVVGVADYWMEFRNRLTRRPMKPKAEA